MYVDFLINNLTGKKGEDLVSEILEKEFDDKYTYLRNYQIPNEFKGGGDIDGILITPKGLFILEVKFYNGTFEIEDGHFHKLTKNGLRRYSFNKPIRQAIKQHEYVLERLYMEGKYVYIRPIVVLANGHISSIKGPTGVYVLEKNMLVDFIKGDMAKIPTILDSTSMKMFITAFQISVPF